MMCRVVSDSTAPAGPDRQRGEEPLELVPQEQHRLLIDQCSNHRYQRRRPSLGWSTTGRTRARRRQPARLGRVAFGRLERREAAHPPSFPMLFADFMLMGGGNRNVNCRYLESGFGTKMFTQ